MGLADGFKALNWQVHPVELGSYFPGKSSLAARVAARLTLPIMIRRYNNAILKKVAAVRPAAFLTVKGGYLKAETLEKIRQSGTLVINFYPDAHFHHHGLDPDSFAHYDRFFTTKSFQVDFLEAQLGRERVEFMHHGYLPAIHTPPGTLSGMDRYAVDIMYIGNHSAEKERQLSLIKRRFPDVNLKIYGNRWRHLKCGTLLESSVVGVPLYGADYAAAINSAKINLGFHMGVTDTSGWYDLVSTRSFEIPACKGFMLHVDNGEIRQLFTPGVEIDVFKDMDELAEKIEFYLAHDELRRDMVERAYARCVPDYSYHERARVIADWITSRS